MILHCDSNSFYASCEQIFRPDLRGKPVAVLSNNDGIIIALTKEAKALGIKRGDPFFKVRHICESNNITVFSSNYTLYADISRRITSIYMEYAPDIEEYSIDESFLFFNRCNFSVQDWYEIGHDLKQRIYKEIGMPICVGAAPTKTLAKLYNKKAKEHNGVFVYEPSKVDALLAQTDCGTIWGIGPARARTLLSHGIKNALQLKDMPLFDAKKLLTIQGFATVQELNGISCIDKVIREKKDVITSSRQFSKKVYDMKTLECALVQYAELAVERLRSQKSEKPELFMGWMEKYGAERMILGADVRQGKVSINGWLEDSEEDLLPFLKKYVDRGVRNVLCTEISKDGTLQGPATELYVEIMKAYPELHLIASGGVASNKDIEELDAKGIPAVVFGKAYYEGKIKVEGLKLC